MLLLNRVKRCRPLLGTFVTIEVEDARSEEGLEALMDVAFGRMARVGALMSFHDAASEVSRLNACAHTHPLTVHEWTREVICRAIAMGEESGGVFDIAVAPNRQKNGFLPRQPGQEPARGTFRDIEVLADGRVKFHQPLQMDLGGIAKGFAVDKAVEFLAAQHLRHASVEAGGDLRWLGDPAGTPPLLHLRDPRGPSSQFLAVPMRGEAVATSAAFFTNRRHRTLKISHLTHPRTGRALKSNVSVSVFAPTCAAADALTKVVLFGEQERWQPLLQREDASAAVVTGRGEVVFFPA